MDKDKDAVSKALGLPHEPRIVRLDLPAEPSINSGPQRALPIRRGVPAEFPAVIYAGNTLSEPIDLRAQALVGLILPKLPASIAVFVRVSVARNGSYYRLQKTDASGDWTIAANTGEKSIFLPDLSPFRHLKVELGAAQTSDVTTYVIARY